MNINESSSLRNVGESIIVIIWMILQGAQHCPLEPISLIELVDSDQYVLSHFDDAQVFRLFAKYKVNNLIFALFLVHVIVYMLLENELDDLLPVLVQDLDAQLVGSNTVRTETLHAKVVDEATFHHAGHVGRNLIVA